MKLFSDFDDFKIFICNKNKIRIENYKKMNKISKHLICIDNIEIKGIDLIIKEINDIKPIAMGSIINGVKNETILYDNTECVSDEKLYRIITSEDCKLISLWIKDTEDEIFKKIKTFSYPGGIEKAGIKLSVDDSMELNQLSFSFLQANI